MDVSTLQLELADLGFAPGPIDGRVGPRTEEAMVEALELSVNTRWRSWSWPRRQVAVEQLIYQELAIETGEVDGLVGPQTLYARQAYRQLKETGALPDWRNATMKPRTSDKAMVDIWPRQPDVERFFGLVGQHQVPLTLPFPMRLAWDVKTVVHRFQLHEKVHDSAAKVFAQILGHYGEQEIDRLKLNLFGGCLNVRKMRGGSAWSMHSWGIAIDFDPAGNQLRWGSDKAGLARPEYDPFWRFWAEAGWLSLGQARDFDWMHVQAARI